MEGGVQFKTGACLMERAENDYLLNVVYLSR